MNIKRFRKVVAVMAVVMGGMAMGLSGCQKPGDDINYFCVGSSFSSLANEHDYNYVYGYAAEVKDGVLVALKYTPSYSNTSAGGEYSKIAYVKGDIFKELQEIVKNNNFAKYNGSSHKVNGLPENFGGSVDIGYVSGENIYYDNNQSPVIGAEVGSDIVNIIKKYIDNNSSDTVDYSQIQAITYSEGSSKNSYSFQRIEKNKLTTESKFEGSDTVYHREYAIDEEAFGKVVTMVKDSCMLNWTGLYERDWELYKITNSTLTITLNDGSEIVIKESMRSPSNTPYSLFNIHMFMNDLAKEAQLIQ